MSLGGPRHRHWILFAISTLYLLGVASYLIQSASLEGPGFPLDDAWIHQTFARNLGQEASWGYRFGQPGAGSTSPLWSGVLGLAYAVGINPITWTMLLGALSLGALGVVCLRWFRARNPGQFLLELWMPLLIFTEWHLLWAALSGMEIVLYSFIVCYVLFRLDVDPVRPMLWGALIGLGVWLRPESLTLLVPASWVIMTRPGNGRAKTKGLGWLAAGLICGLGPYLVFHQVLDGTWWPSTLYAKQAEYAARLGSPLILRFFDQLLQPLTGVGILLAPGIIWTTISSIRRRRWEKLAPILWASVHLGAYALRLPVTYQHGRYSMPVIPVLLLLGVEGTIAFQSKIKQGVIKRVIGRVWTASAALTVFGFILLGSRAYGMDVAVIETEMVRSASWIEQHTPPSSLIGAHDIGALGYFSDREVLDLAGLVSPEVVPIIRDEKELAELMDARKVDYLMTFPGWYPVLTSGKRVVFQSAGSYSPALGGDNMRVYRWR